MGLCGRVFDSFDADFVAIQGDGAFGLFVGDSRYERAMCAGITITTFSRTMVEKLGQRWDNFPETGLKVGVASSPILVKKVDTPRNHDQQEPVWAGRAVNYAAKAAQGADRHRLAVTASVWRDIAKNDYLAFSCPCNDGPSTRIWCDVTIQNLPEEDDELCLAGRARDAGAFSRRFAGSGVNHETISPLLGPVSGCEQHGCSSSDNGRILDSAQRPPARC